MRVRRIPAQSTNKKPNRRSLNTRLLGNAVVKPEVLLRQADLLAKCFHSRIAAEQDKLRVAEYMTHSNGPHYCRAIQSLQCAFLITQAREDRGLLERI